MIRYVVRRLLQAIPTVAGVVLITFLLFQGVGGSPAAMVLGQNAGAASLEEFDAAHGYNKPLFWGRWAATRALEPVTFDEETPASLRTRWGVEDSAGPLRLTEGEALNIPFAFPPAENETWRLRMTGRGPGFPGKDSARTRTYNVFFRRDGATFYRVEEVSTVWKKFSIVWKNFSNDWKKNSTPWKTDAHDGIRSKLIEEPAEGGAGNTEAGALFCAGPGGAEIWSVRLERKTAHGWDSQLWDYVRKLGRWDLGTSTSLNRPVSELLRSGVGPSLALTIPILVVELVVSLTLALLCAYRRGSWLDRGLVGVCVALMSVNYLVWIVAGQFVLAYKWGWFPVWGFESWRNLLLPVGIGAATGIGVNVRFYRTVLLEEMNKEYVRTARAKGLGQGRILFVHVLKNALGPVITNVALALPFLYTGSLLLEGFFGIPGLGYLSLNAIHSADVEVVRGVVLVGALLFTLANVLADVALAWVDPRVRLS